VGGKKIITSYQSAKLESFLCALRAAAREEYLIQCSHSGWIVDPRQQPRPEPPFKGGLLARENDILGNRYCRSVNQFV